MSTLWKRGRINTSRCRDTKTRTANHQPQGSLMSPWAGLAAADVGSQNRWNTTCLRSRYSSQAPNRSRDIISSQNERVFGTLPFLLSRQSNAGASNDTISASLGRHAALESKVQVEILTFLSCIVTKSESFCYSHFESPNEMLKGVYNVGLCTTYRIRENWCF